LWPVVLRCVQKSEQEVGVSIWFTINLKRVKIINLS
jgi:hypothetical protein